MFHKFKILQFQFIIKFFSSKENFKNEEQQLDDHGGEDFK